MSGMFLCVVVECVCFGVFFCRVLVINCEAACIGYILKPLPNKPNLKGYWSDQTDVAIKDKTLYYF